MKNLIGILVTGLGVESIFVIAMGNEDFKWFAAYLQLGSSALVKGDIYEMLKAMMPLVESKLAIAKNQNATSSVAIDPRFARSEN